MSHKPILSRARGPTQLRESDFNIKSLKIEEITIFFHKNLSGLDGQTKYVNYLINFLKRRYSIKVISPSSNKINNLHVSRSSLLYFFLFKFMNFLKQLDYFIDVIKRRGKIGNILFVPC